MSYVPFDLACLRWRGWCAPHGKVRGTFRVSRSASVLEGTILTTLCQAVKKNPSQNIGTLRFPQSKVFTKANHRPVPFENFRSSSVGTRLHASVI
jgi:hypothetical protein